MTGINGLPWHLLPIFMVPRRCILKTSQVTFCGFLLNSVFWISCLYLVVKCREMTGMDGSHISSEVSQHLRGWAQKYVVIFMVTRRCILKMSQETFFWGWGAFLKQPFVNFMPFLGSWKKRCDRNGWFVMTFITDIHGPQRMNVNETVFSWHFL